MNIQDLFPLELTGLISLQSKGLSRVFSSTTVQSINSSVLSLLYGPTLTSIHDYWKNHSFDQMDLCQQSDVSWFWFTNQLDVLKTVMPAGSNGQQKGPDSSPWEHLTAHCTIITLKVEQIRLQSFASSSIFTLLLTNWLPLLQASQQLFAGKTLHNQQDGENAFQQFIESRSMVLYTTGISKLISLWQKCVDNNGSYFD